MQYNTYTLNVPTSVAAGTAQSRIEPCEHMAVQIFGTFSATCVVEASANGTNFTAVSGSVTTPSWIQIPFAVKAVRINVTAYTSGTPQAILTTHTRSS